MKTLSSSHFNSLGGNIQRSAAGQKEEEEEEENLTPDPVRRGAPRRSPSDVGLRPGGLGRFWSGPPRRLFAAAAAVAAPAPHGRRDSVLGRHGAEVHRLQLRKSGNHPIPTEHTEPHGGRTWSMCGSRLKDRSSQASCDGSDRKCPTAVWRSRRSAMSLLLRRRPRLALFFSGFLFKGRRAPPGSSDHASEDAGKKRRGY
ncbi:hypothetical protein EYF80_055721 [Liparis tanakae]|uniref:Uncharacterized protein n=1 Tax=Liparis tanakae TaxID=230148 RepID=A0A4Z2F0D8_9TELE|nr:hypothetical protein EYF80_055721 [Liparis tanakae]